MTRPEDPLPLSWLRGSWMQTWTGRRFFPMNPRPEDIDPADIAHALSMLCRYGGHVDRFYSVAEHCVLMSEAVAPEHALAALLHDATEAYVVDVPRPLKLALPDYRAIEAQVWKVIAIRFGVAGMPDEVKTADNRILLTERNALISNAVRPWEQDGRYEPLPVRITGWLPAEAERRYRDRLGVLMYPTNPVAQAHGHIGDYCPAYNGSCLEGFGNVHPFTCECGWSSGPTTIETSPVAAEAYHQHRLACEVGL
jgi:hypothetical protein